jgi:magnesium-transporting ATPase (P-type)
MVGSSGSFDHARWLSYTALVCAQAVRAYSNRSLMLPLTRLRRNGFLLAACVITVAVQLAIPYVPALAEAFRATPLDLGEWALVGCIAVAPAVLAEAVRRLGRGPWVA